MAHASQCMCGHRSCKDWHVFPHAAMQGVKFTQHQAELISAVLNGTAVVIPAEDAADANRIKDQLDTIVAHLYGFETIILQKEE